MKRHHADFRFSGNKVTSDEIDRRVQYQVLWPSVGTATVGTIAAGTAAAAWTLITTKTDYPRNLLFTVVGPSGGVGGTSVVNGTDQFGASITETVTIASANAGGTTAGTKIFDTVTSGTYYPNGVDNTSTATLGYAIGTAATLTGWFGLPVRIGSTSDVKRYTRSFAGVVLPVNGGTISSYISTTTHAFKDSVIGTATTSYSLDILSTYNSENEVNVG